jgi:hypothetical protein
MELGLRPSPGFQGEQSELRGAVRQRKAFRCARDDSKGLWRNDNLLSILKAGLLNDCGEPGIKRGLTQPVFYELARPTKWPPLRTVEPGAVVARLRLRLRQRMRPCHQKW